MTAEDVQQIRGLFDGAVASVDDAMARILAELDARGLRERTIIVVTADHGETIFDNEHGQGHGDHLFGDEATHVPLLIIDPRHAIGRRDDRIVRDVDVAATLYALTDTAPPADLDGVSLAPALDGAPTPIRFAAPTLGQSTDAILRDLLGYDDARLADLAARNITGTSAVPPRPRTQ